MAAVSVKRSIELFLPSLAHVQEIYINKINKNKWEKGKVDVYNYTFLNYLILEVLWGILKTL